MAGPAVLIHAECKFPFVEPDAGFRSTTLADRRIMRDSVQQYTGSFIVERTGRGDCGPGRLTGAAGGEASKAQRR